MKMIEIGKSGIKTSAITLGTIAYGTAKTEQEVVQTEKILDKCLELGINFIDTAPVYGTSASETLLGKALKDRRSRFVIQTKCGLNWRGTGGEQMEYIRDGKEVYRDLTPAAIRKDLEDSLRRLNTDYIDIYMTHRQSLVTPPEEIAGELLRLKQEGKIRAIGLSNANVQEISAYAQHMQIDLLQQKYSILDQRFAASHFPLCQQLGITYQAWGVLDHGGLTGTRALESITDPNDPRAMRSVAFQPEMKPHMYIFFEKWSKFSQQYGCSIPALIVRYSLTRYNNMNVLVGTDKLAELEDNVRALSIDIEPAVLAEMDHDVQVLLRNKPAWESKNPTND